MPLFKSKEEYEMYKPYVDENGTDYMIIPAEHITNYNAKVESPKVIKNPAPFKITLEELNDSNKYTKSQIQDEKVKYGIARCENESKDKSISKLKKHLEKLKANESCMLRIDDDQLLECTYPPGKTRLDLNKLLNEFFTPAEP